MTTYRLSLDRSVPVAPPVLDEFQQSVVDHPGGPLLVLAGPGTGKTTTLVEAIVDRIETRGASPESVLALTFSRKAAEQLRDRVTARLGRTMATTLSSTFHSFAYGLVRRYSSAELYAAPLRLLSAPEQDVILQELLKGNREDALWPSTLDQAVSTRGFAKEVQAVLSRAREKGLDPLDLKVLGEEVGAPELVAAAQFMQQYQVILDDQSSIDYPELIYRAVLLAEQPAIRADLRARFAHVFVDEYQDTDPSQVRLLRAIAGDGRDLTVVGDPDQSIYAFRGAEVRGILDFPRAFRQRDDSPAHTVALRVTRRFGPRLLRLSRAVVSGLATTGSIDADTFAAFRQPEARSGEFGAGRADVLTFDTERAETEHVADLLRRAHLEDGVPWSEMAVLVRSGRTSIPRLRRALGAAGVPVEVASDDTPLVQEPAVLPLLDALHAVVDLDKDDPADVDHFGADRAESLLGSPVGGLDATEVRALARALRAREKRALAADAEETGAGRGARSSPALLREALLDPGRLEGVRERGAAKALALAELLQRGRALLDDGATAEEVLWLLWSGSDWPRRLRRGVDLGGQAARLGHRDLDAICALFEVAARAEEQRGHTSVVSFLESLRAQQIPADTLAERGVRGEAVRLLTAHRSKGLEWRFVVVAHVQDEGWPDLRRRSTLLHADRIGADGILPPLGRPALLAEERRLFYVACTRARERLLVTAVASPEDDGEQPSRFVDELAAAAQADGAGGFVRHRHLQGRPPRPLSLPGLVADLRRTLSEPTASPALRRAAADRLAVLAQASHRGHPLVASADPGQWWGTRARSICATPVERPDAPVTLSASSLDAILSCPAKWFLERKAGGEMPSSQSQGFGLVVHTLADRIAKGEIAAGNGSREEVLAELMGHVDTVWDQIAFRTPWSRSRERDEVRAALGRFLDWHTAPGARTVLATEQHLTAEVTLPDGQRVRLNGYADRLEVDDRGRVVVIDLKTSKYPPTDKDLPTNPQLGIYQHAVANGAVDDLVVDALDGPAVPGGAELVQLRKGLVTGAKIQKQDPQEPDAEGHRPVEVQLMRAARVIRDEVFDATPGKHCEHCQFHAICPTKAAGTVLS